MADSSAREQLAAMFPDAAPEALDAVLEMSNNDVATATNFLLGEDNAAVPASPGGGGGGGFGHGAGTRAAHSSKPPLGARPTGSKTCA